MHPAAQDLVNPRRGIVEDASRSDRERELVGAGVEGSPRHHLGRDESWRSRGRRLARRPVDSSRIPRFAPHPRQAEVRQVDASIVADQDIARLDVAMHESGPMRRFESTRDADYGVEAAGPR